MSVQTRKITLVCSLHRENGLCNAEELLRILRTVEPETVFEEVRPSDFDSYCKHGRSLGALAIAKYCESRSLRRVPVDRYDIPENRISKIKGELDSVFDYVEWKSRDYRLLNEARGESVNRHGSGYLNSVAFATTMARIIEVEDEVITETGDVGLIRALEEWRHLMQRRDREMVSSIYEYCRQNAFDSGVFLVGAAHRTGIAKEIAKYARMEADQIDWALCL